MLQISAPCLVCSGGAAAGVSAGLLLYPNFIPDPAQMFHLITWHFMTLVCHLCDIFMFESVCPPPLLSTVSLCCPGRPGTC